MNEIAEDLCSAIVAAARAARLDGLADSDIAHVLAIMVGHFLEQNRIPGIISGCNGADDERAAMASHFGMLVLDAMKHRAKATAEGGA